MTATLFVSLVSIAVVGVEGGYVRSDFPIIAGSKFDGDYMKQHGSAIRHKRGTVATELVVKGRNAVRIILNGAKRLPSDDHSTKFFEKTGNLKSALSDFRATNPVTVSDGHKTFPFGPKIYYMNDRVYGQAGDRILRLDKYDEDVGNPVMTIIQKIDSSHYRVYKVVYTQ